jgi:hypothetical protein
MLMTLEEAILYVFKTLNNYWKETHIEDLGRLLGELHPSYISDTKKVGTGDPAAWYNWVNAVRKIAPNEYITEEDAIKTAPVTNDPTIWDNWVEAVRKTLPNQRITEEQAIKAIIELMKQYNNEGFDLNDVINYLNNKYLSS